MPRKTRSGLSSGDKVAVIVISTFMALIVAGLIATGTRNRGRPKRRGYPVED
jgi:hypothetical protein